MHYFLLLLLTLAGCFGIQSLALHSVGGKTNKSESNFFSSVARIQTGIRDQPEIMLLGSSMTGRLPDRNQDFTGVANLGCDGSSALDTLRAMDAGSLPIAPVLVIEGNTLHRALAAQVTEITKAIHSPWFKIGTRISQLGATARPSAFAYSKLLARKIGNMEGPNGPMLPVSSIASIQVPDSSLPADADVLVREVDSIFKRLQARDVRLMLVMLPPGAATDSLNRRIPYEISSRSLIPLLDLNAGLPANAVRYTDGVHMDPTSAAAALRSILAALKTK
jgi:hypothetical protein